MLLLMYGNEILVNEIDEEGEDHGGVKHHEHTITFHS
jgi:hypothetical protein